jgi:hypothetical protein
MNRYADLLCKDWDDSQRGKLCGIVNYLSKKQLSESIDDLVIEVSLLNVRAERTYKLIEELSILFNKRYKKKVAYTVSHFSEELLTLPLKYSGYTVEEAASHALSTIFRPELIEVMHLRSSSSRNFYFKVIPNTRFDRFELEPITLRQFKRIINPVRVV